MTHYACVLNAKLRVCFEIFFYHIRFGVRILKKPVAVRGWHLSQTASATVALFAPFDASALLRSPRPSRRSSLLRPPRRFGSHRNPKPKGVLRKSVQPTKRCCSRHKRYDTTAQKARRLHNVEGGRPEKTRLVRDYIIARAIPV